MLNDDFFAPAAPSDPIALADSYDELPLWSAPFGLALLDTVRLRQGIVGLDVGCGTGFPLIELAERLGRTAQMHGVDPSAAALARVRKKLAVKAVNNVVLHETSIEQLPMPDASFDLIVSNNGLNNCRELELAVAECARVARPGAQLVYTYNLPESMRELYDVYASLLLESGLHDARAALDAHIASKRKPLAFTTSVLERAGFRVEELRQSAFALRFADASAMFEHFLMRIAFVPSWLELAPAAQQKPIFRELELRLNRRAQAAGALTLTIPFACYDCRRS